MTDTISDEARTLVAEVLKASLYENISKGVNPALVAQVALTDARNKALEDAAGVCEDKFNASPTNRVYFSVDSTPPDTIPLMHDCLEAARVIRAMKVQP